MAAGAGLKAEVEALRIAILAAGRAQADAADPTLQQLAPAAFDRAQIAENAVAQWRDSVRALYAALEASGHVEGQPPEGSAPATRVVGPVEG